MADCLSKIAIVAVIILSCMWSAPTSAHDRSSCVEVHFAPGASSAVIQGEARHEAVECFTFRAGTGQTAHLRVSGANMFITVIGVGDARSEWTFKTEARTYKFLVGQMERSNRDKPYTVTLSIKASSHCDLDQLPLCQNTNQLAGSKLFINAVTKFLAGRRGNYLYEATVADQVIEVLGGPPDDVNRIGDLYRFTACRPHSCTEKGAVVLEPNGNIIALGILHTHCADLNRPADCFAHDTLTYLSESRINGRT